MSGGFLTPEYRLAHVQPSGQPLQAPQVQTSAAMFGGTQGAMLERAGQQLGLAGDELQKFVIKRASIQNEADAKAADAAATDEMRGILFDPKSGYYGKRGKDAIDAAPTILQQLDGLKKKHAEKLSGEAANMFDTAFTRRIESAQDQISRKVLVEQQTYADQGSDARVQGFKADAENSYTDQKVVDKQLAGIAGEITSQAELSKENPDVTVMKIRKEQSSALVGVIRRWVDDDPYRAKVLRDQYAGKIDGQDNVVVDKLIKEGLLRRGSQDRADAIRNGNSGEGKLEYNIGNIVKSGFTYAGGKGAPQGAFETFTTPEHGVAAAYTAIAAKAKQNGGAISFNDLIGGNAKVNGWAKTPTTDAEKADPMLKGNNAEAYAAVLAKSVGLKPADNVPIDDDGKMATLLAQMNRTEKGKQTVPDKAFGAGIQLAKTGKAEPAEKPELDARGQPTLQWQIDQAQKITDPDMRDATLMRVRQLHAQDETVRNDQRRAVGQEVQALITTGNLTEVAQIPVDKWTSLDPTQQRAFLVQMDQNAKGKDPSPNPTLYVELSRQLVEDPDAFKKRDLAPLAAQLPRADWIKFQDAQTNMGKKENVEAEKQVSITRGLQVSDALLKSAGIYLGYLDNKGKKLREKDFEDFRSQFQYSLLHEIERFRAENGGKRPSDDDLTKMGDRLLLQGRFRGTSVLPLVGSDDKAIAFQQRPGESAPQFYMRYSDIPDDRRKAVESQLRAKGLPYDKAAVEQAYTAWRLAGNR